MTSRLFNNSILRAVAGDANKPNEISGRTGIAQTSLPRYLKTLINLGILERTVPFGENPETSRQSTYRISEACYDFWFRFVVPYTTEIEGGLGEIITRATPDSQINEYLGKCFERVCAEWFINQAKQAALPIAATSVGSWQGTNPATKSQTDIDVLAADKTNKQVVIGECKYRTSFNVSEVVEGLKKKSELVKGYDTCGFYVFSRYHIEESIASAHPDVHFVSLENF